MLRATAAGSAAPVMAPPATRMPGRKASTWPLQINSFVLDILIGALIVIAVLIDSMGKNKKK